MRLLIYAMMSSGATSFALFLAQRPDCLALVDTLNFYAAPRVATRRDMLVKVTMTTAFPLAVHLDRFVPNRVVLFLRDPRDIYASLKTKPYRNQSGLMDEKFRLYESVFAERDRFDAVIHYEDFVARDPSPLADMTEIGWPATADYYRFSRRHEILFSELYREMPELYERHELNFGNVQGREISNAFLHQPRKPEDAARLEELCPQVLAYYRARERKT